MKKIKFNSKTNCYYTYMPTGMIKKDGKPEYKKIRAKSAKNLEEKIGGKN